MLIVELENIFSFCDTSFSQVTFDKNQINGIYFCFYSVLPPLPTTSGWGLRN